MTLPCDSRVRGARVFAARPDVARRLLKENIIKRGVSCMKFVWHKNQMKRPS